MCCVGFGIDFCFFPYGLNGDGDCVCFVFIYSHNVGCCGIACLCERKGDRCFKLLEPGVMLG